MRIGINIAIICVVAIICIAAVTCVALAQGYDSTLPALAFVAIGAIPSAVIAKIAIEHKYKKPPKAD